jgi:hypothetical protein
VHPASQLRTWYQILSCFCASPFSGYHGSFPKGYYPNGFYQKRRHNLVFDTSQKSFGCLVSHTRLQLAPQTSMHTCIAELCLGTFQCKTPIATLATHIATHATHTGTQNPFFPLPHRYQWKWRRSFSGSSPPTYDILCRCT